MWNEIVQYLPQFPNAVLTGIDAGGYPFSIRCEPQVDEARKVLRIAPPGEARILPGPAGLLCHSHNAELWDLKSIQILGRLEQAGREWIFHPDRFTPGGGLQGPLGQMRALMKARADAKRYLQKRSLPRPKIAWDEFKEVKAEIKNGK